MSQWIAADLLVIMMGSGAVLCQVKAAPDRFHSDSKKRMKSDTVSSMPKAKMRLACFISFICLMGFNSTGIAFQHEHGVVSDSVDLSLDFEALDLQGELFSGTSLKGKIVLLDIWAVWCAPCFAAFPTMNKIHREFEGDSFEVVGIAVYSGTIEAVKEVAEAHDLDYRILVGDENLAEKFEIIGVPTYFLLRSDAKVYKKYIGDAEGFYQEVRQDIFHLKKVDMTIDERDRKP